MFIPVYTPAPFDFDERRPGEPLLIDLTLPKRCVLLLGERGSGKTTLLRWLASEYAEEVAAGRLVLLDDADAKSAARQARARRKARIFATGAAAIDGFETREILPWNADQIWKYAELWAEQERLGEEFPFQVQRAVRSHEGLASLASRPLILAEIVRMIGNGARFPEQRAELFAWVEEQIPGMAEPAMKRYRGCLGMTEPPWGRELVCLYGAIQWRRGGQAAVDRMVAEMVRRAGRSLAERAAVVAELYALETDLMGVELAGYKEMVREMTALFTDAGADVPLRVRVEAAEALGRAGDPRLRLPADDDYWVKVGDLEMGRFPVTVYEYADYLRAGGKEPARWAGKVGHPNRPVTDVSWYEAVEYCKWAGGWLPTEGEWASALAGRFAWGEEDDNGEQANCSMLGLHTPTPVGLFPRGNSPAGVADLCGNVWEWVDGVPGTPDGEGMCIIRGGSCRTDTKDHSWNHAAFGHDIIGFRCVRANRS